MATHASPASPLWQRIEAQGLRTVAVMGMSKNTGKTVCLNHLMAQAHAAGRTLGITSIGRDGEERDEVFAVPKPPVRVTAGCLVATARDTLLRAKARTKMVGATGIHSPMGEILVVKALEAGDMEVAGASLSQDQHKVIGLLRQCGAEHVLLDGALGRSHHASPAIADGVILATGAALGGGMGDVVRKTCERLAILNIAAADHSLAERVQAVFSRGGVGVWRSDGQCIFHEPIATLNAAVTLLDLQAQGKQVGGWAVLAVSGAVGKRLWQAIQTLLAQHPGLTLVVADGTRLFIDAADLRTFERQGGRLVAMRGIHLLGVTLNPFSPLGGSFDAAAFEAQARATLAPHLVTDLMLSHSSPTLQEEGS